MDSSLDRERLVCCGSDIVYRLRRRRHAGRLHRLWWAWHHESKTLAIGLHAVATSIGITR